MFVQNSTKELNIYSNPLNISEDKAATCIQKCIRGHLARKPFLTSHLYSQYSILCKKAMSPEGHSIPQAEGGKTKVFLPQEMPCIVLKSSGRKAAIKRFHQMQEVRAILNEQKSSHLIIPRASLCGNFLVEQRLPINANCYHNMALYLSQPQLFDEAVREMVRLFSKIYLSDLVSYQILPLGHIEGVEDYVRYDNLPLYIEEKRGKKEGIIGLIDLEHIKNNPSPQVLDTLVRIFPFHLDLIKEEAQKLEMNIDLNSLEAASEKGKKFLRIGFSDHLKWLKQKDEFAHFIFKPFQVSSERVDELTNLVKKELLKRNEGIIEEQFVRKDCPFQKNFLTEKPEELAKELAPRITPLIIENLKKQIKNKQSKVLSSLSGQELKDSELVFLRSPIIKRPKLYKGVLREMRKIQFEKSNLYEKIEIVEQLIHAIMQELIRGGEIFYYDPAYYTSGHQICWIRY